MAISQQTLDSKILPLIPDARLANPEGIAG